MQLPPGKYANNNLIYLSGREIEITFSLIFKIWLSRLIILIRGDDMSDKFKVVVAGAGPGGCIFARDLAKAGIDVTVYEKGDYETIGHDWSDAMERSALASAGFEAPFEGSFNTGPLVKTKDSAGNISGIYEQHAYPYMEVWSPDYSSKKLVNFRYVTTDRRAFGKLLADQAKQAGARILFRHEVIDLISGGGERLGDVDVKGIVVRNTETGETVRVEADIIADDTGFNAVLRTKLSEATGIARRFSEDEFAMVFRTVRKRNKNAVDPMNDHYRYGYNTGYQWMQYLNEDEIDTGSGVRHDPKSPDPKDIVKEFISRHPSISDEVVRGGGGLCLVGRSPASLVAKGFVVIGDAASQTIPMTGCGAGGAMMGGKFAAEAVISAASRGKNDCDALWEYNWKWFVGSKRGANYAGLTAIRNILQGLSHEEISFLFRKDILSNEMLTDSINGIFTLTDIPTMIKILVGGITRPGILLKLNAATTAGAKIFKHYLAYPAVWDAAKFEAWRLKADQLFAATVC
jgi:flavin-dependent dehydrogenase